MSIINKLIIVLVLSLILRLFLIYLNSHNPQFSFLQENYDLYLEALKNGSISNIDFSPYEKRLFPGYILLILPFSYFINNIIGIGIFINLILFSLSFVLIWKIFKNLFINIIFAFFPPVWIIQSTKASTEPLTITLLLSAIFVLMKKYYFMSGLILGLAFNVRIISFCLLIAISFVLFFERKFEELFRIFAGFIITASLLILYNFFVFGNSNLFIQFLNLDENYGVVRIGFIQIFYDILRTIDWGQYRILFSGTFYLFINFLSLIILFKYKKKSRILKICFYWVLFSLIFIFLLSPFTLIENFSRYAVVVNPAIAVSLVYFVEKIYIKFKLPYRYPKFFHN